MFKRVKYLCFNNFGFTLIELLIVIALLGALAVGLLAALDPFEQLKKGTDVGIRNTVSEVHGAVIRYFAIRNSMPWDIDPESEADDNLVMQAISEGSDASSAIQRIVEVGELKQDFFALGQNQLNRVFITGTKENVAVCYHPNSRAERTNPNSKWTPGDTDGTIEELSGCPNPTGKNADGIDCDWCVK